MSKHFITGAARSVTNSVERLTELRKNHPEWDDRPSEKALARERLVPRAPARDAVAGLRPGRALQSARESRALALHAASG